MILIVGAHMGSAIDFVHYCFEQWFAMELPIFAHGIYTCTSMPDSISSGETPLYFCFSSVLTCFGNYFELTSKVLYSGKVCPPTSQYFEVSVTGMSMEHVC